MIASAVKLAGAHGAHIVSGTTSTAIKSRFEDRAQILAGMLKLSNGLAYAERYKDTSDVDSFVDMRDGRDDLTAVELLKAIDCYEYQASEYSKYEGSGTQSIVSSLRKSAIAALPGYDAADTWGIY
jgi:hypothetical protein